MRQVFSGGIQTRLSRLLGLSIGAIALMAVAIWQIGIAPALQTALIEKQQEIARRAAEQIDHFLDQRISELQGTIMFGSLSRGDSGRMQKDLWWKFLEATPRAHSISIIDDRGQARLSVARDPFRAAAAPLTYRSTLIFTEGRQGRIHVSEVLYASNGEPFVTIGIPLRNAQKEIDAVLAAEVSLESLWNSISAIRVGKAGQLYIVSPGGILIAHRNSVKVALGLNLANLDAVSRFIGRAAQSSHETRVGETGKLGLSSYAVVSRTGWGVIAEEDAETALAPIRRVKWMAGALLLCAIAGSFVFSHRFSLRITRPIRMLEHGAQLISQGQLEQKIVFHSGDEVQSLAENFNRMADALKASYDDLEGKISERTKEISGLYAALAPIKPGGSLDEMLMLVLERLLQATGATAATLRLQNCGAGFSEYAITQDAEPARCHVEGVGPAGSAAEAVFMRGMPIFCTDITTDFRFRRPAQPNAGVRSCAVLPLIVSGTIRGIIELTSRVPGYFQPEKQEHLMAITRQMGVTIENHQLFLETERHRRDNEILYRTGEAVRQSLQVPTLARAALIRMLENFEFDVARAYLQDDPTGLFRLIAEHGAALDSGADFHDGPSDGTMEFCVGDWNEAAKHPQLGLTENGLGAFATMAGFPITIDRRQVGVIYLYATQHRDLSTEDHDLLCRIGAQIGSAIENAWLYEKAQRSLERIRALHEIDKAITSSLDLDTVLQVLLQKVEIFLLLKGTCAVHLFHPMTGALDRAACHDAEGQYSEALNDSGYDELPQMVADKRAAVSVLDLNNDVRVPGRCHIAGTFRSYLGVPLMVRDDVFGVLSYFTPLRHAFSDVELEFLRTLAGQGAIALHNARLYEQIKRQTVELEKSNKIKDDFLCVVSHELKTPLMAVSGYTSLLNEDVLGVLTAEQRRATRVIERNCHELMHMVHTILEAAKLQNHTATIHQEEVDIAALLDELAQTCAPPRDKPVEMVWTYDSELPKLLTDRDKLKHILQNLLSNALKFTEAGSITVSIADQPELRRVRFRVVDTGVGIAADQLPLIYDKFRQVDSSAKRGYEGAGLGLYIVREFTRLLGGEIEVESQPNKGSTFSVTVPYTSDGAIAPGFSPALTEPALEQSSSSPSVLT